MTVTASRSPSKRLFGSVDFRRLFVGQAISGFGDWMGTVALMALVLDVSGSSTAVGVVLVLRLAPTAVAGPLATRLVRRLDRRRTMLAMDALRVGVVALLPIVHQLWWIYIWAFVLEAAGLVFLPARDASIPDLVDDRDEDALNLADSLVLASSYGTIPLGAGAFSVLAALVDDRHGTLVSGITIAFWVDALTFVGSYIAISRIRLPAGSGASAAADDEAHETKFLDAFKIPLVRSLLMPAFVAALGIGSLFSLGIVFVRDVLGASDTEFAVLVVLFGVGAAVGLLGLRLSHANGVGVVRVCLGLQGAVIAGMSLSPSVGIAFLGAVGFGAATAATLAASMQVIQETLEKEQRVLAFSAFHVMIRAALALAAIGAGVAADLVSSVEWPVVGTLPSVRLVLLASGLLVLVTTVISGRYTRVVRTT